MFGEDFGGIDFDPLLANAIALQQKGQLIGALKSYEEYLEKYKNKLPERLLVHIYGLLAPCYWQAAMLDKSIETYQQLLPLRKKHQNKIMYALSLSNMGKVYALKMEYDKALNNIKEAIIIVKEENASSEQISIAYQQYMFVLNQIGEIRQAIKAGLVSLKYSSQIDLNKTMLKYKHQQFYEVIRNLSETLRILNAFDASFHIIDQAIEFAKNESNQNPLNMLMLEKSKIFEDTYQFDKAEELINQCYESFKSFHDYKGLCDTLFAMAYMYQNKGNFPMALIKMGECLKESEKHGIIHLVKQSKSVLDDWAFMPILDKDFKNKTGKNKDELENIVGNISKNEGITRLETPINQITTIFDSIHTMDMSNDGNLIGFGPMDIRLKVWDLKNQRVIVDFKPGVNLHSLLVKFHPNNNNFTIVADITNELNIHDSSAFIILMKFYVTKTIDGRYKEVNRTFRRLEVPVEDARLHEFSDDGKKVYMIRETLVEILPSVIEDFTENSDGKNKSQKLGTAINAMYAWETNTGSFLFSHHFPDLAITNKFLTINYEKEMVFFLNRRLNLEIRKLKTNVVVKEIWPHCSPFSYLSVNKNLNIIAYENQDGDFEVWNMEIKDIITKIKLTSKVVKEINTDIRNKDLTPPFGSIVCCLSNDGALLAFDGADEIFYIYDISNRKILKQFPSPKKHISLMKFTRNNEKLLIATYKQESYIIDLT